MLTGRGKNEYMKEQPLPDHSKIPGTPKTQSTIIPCSLAEPASVSHNDSMHRFFSDSFFVTVLRQAFVQLYAGQRKEQVSYKHLPPCALGTFVSFFSENDACFLESFARYANRV